MLYVLNNEFQRKRVTQVFGKLRFQFLLSPANTVCLDNAFRRVCLSVCLSVCNVLTFEILDLESSFLVRF